MDLSPHHPVFCVMGEVCTVLVSLAPHLKVTLQLLKSLVLPIDLVPYDV